MQSYTTPVVQHHALLLCCSPLVLGLQQTTKTFFQHLDAKKASLKHMSCSSIKAFSTCTQLNGTCTPVGMLTFVSHPPDESIFQTPPSCVTQAEHTNFILDNIHTPPTHTNFIHDSIHTPPTHTNFTLESTLCAMLHMHKYTNLILDSILYDMLHM